MHPIGCGIVYGCRKEIFISTEVTSVRIQLQLLAPQFHMAAAQPVPKRRLPCRNDGVGLQLRGHKCRPD